MFSRRTARAACGLAIAALISLQTVACAPARASAEMTAPALAAQIEQGSAPLILDVRTPAEYAEGHIPGALNIDHRELAERVESLRAYAGQPVVVYCERGVRAGIANRILSEAGFSTIIQLSGDMRAWRAAVLPIETN